MSLSRMKLHCPEPPPVEALHIDCRSPLRMKLHWALLLAVGVTVFSTLVFSYALGLPFRRIGPWLTF